MQVRKNLHEFSGLHPNISKTIFRIYYPEIVKDNFNSEYNKWRQSILDSTVWGGVAHMTLFAFCYKIHAVCVSAWNTRVTTTYTYGIERMQKVHIISSSEGNPPFNTQPRNPQDIIFIWHHNMGELTNYVGRPNGPNNNVFYNHFSLLEPTLDPNTSAEIVSPHEDSDD
jgi:hypothetical protein